MKYCPLCKSQYTDETLRFCLDDGTPLNSEVAQSLVETVAFSQPLTIGEIQQTEEMRINFANETPNDKTQKKFKPYFVNPVKKVEPPKSARSFLFAGLLVFVVLGTAGFGGWFYLNQPNDVPKQNFNDQATASNTAEKKLPVANISIASTETISEKTTTVSETNSDHSGVKKEIADFINAWKESFQSRNLAEFSAKYAEKIDYYDKIGANIKDVRNEVQKTFTDYTEIEITLANINIAVNAENDKATAVFDKESTYESGKDLIESKVHAKLQFEKVGNEWKIVSEKTLKTYYVEN